MAEIEEKKEKEEEKVEMKEEELESRGERADVDKWEYEQGKEAGEKEEKEKMGAKFEERSDEFFDHMFDLLRKIAVAVGAEVDEDDAEVEVDETVGVEIEEEEALAPAEDMKMGARGNLVAKLSGQIAALESRAKKQDRDAKITSLVDNGMKALAAWSPDEDIRVKMSELANNAKSPAKSVRTFVTTYKQTVPRTPPATFEEYSANAAVADHPEVMRFQAEGPEQFEKAREASLMFDDLAERGVIKSTRAQFIATTLRDNN